MILKADYIKANLQKLKTLIVPLISIIFLTL